MTLERALVSRIYGAYYEVMPVPLDGRAFPAKLRGKLRIAERSAGVLPQRNPILVGDYVEAEFRAQEDAIIHSVEPRLNMLIRSLNYEAQALGANLDRAILVQSIAQPEANLAFVDRFLASCYAGAVDPILCFTKSDLGMDQNLRGSIEHYTSLGIPVFLENLLDEKKAIMNGFSLAGATLLAGRSGTGKSTLLNRLLKKNIQKTSMISESTGKGRHTTTNSLLFLTDEPNSFIIDTPGVKEWGVMHCSMEEILFSLPELRKLMGMCEFKDCKHQPLSQGCVIQKEMGLLRPDRRKNLESMMESLNRYDKIRTGDYIKATGRMRKR